MDAPCELGASASDPDGGGSPSDPVAVDLSSQVVVCPPDNCISRGCSLQELRRHFFRTKGLRGCGIDTMAAVGARFEVTFWVWDAGSPPRNASVTRVVSLSDPCPNSNTPYFCTDTAGANFCSGRQLQFCPDVQMPVLRYT
jgi:hypothetical protein